MRVVTCLVLLASAFPAYAMESPKAVTPLDGYVCARLRMSEAEARSMRPNIFIRTAPAETAPVGTAAPSILFLRDPARFANGFIEVLQITGKPGWIEERRVETMEPYARCRPTLMSNGRIGAGL